jgi:hypothetical protein
MLTEAMADRDKGHVFVVEDVTVGEYVKRWLEALPKASSPPHLPQLSPVGRKHITPAPGRERLVLAGER